MPTHFRIQSLDPAPWAQLLQASDEVLHRAGAARVIADRRPGYPCRVSLQDAEPGESLLLVPFAHQPGDTPYRASGPVYLRERAQPLRCRVDEVPAVLHSRKLSVRAYDGRDWLIAAEVCEGTALEEAIEAQFGNPAVRYLHIHFAGPGCFACRVDRTDALERVA